jgi:hypothetical protein
MEIAPKARTGLSCDRYRQMPLRQFLKNFMRKYLVELNLNLSACQLID